MTTRLTKNPRRKKAVRTYSSPLREEQAEQTRLRIMQAYGDEICQGDQGEITMRQVAERAKVAVPTLYRNFTSIDELSDAYWAWFEPKLGAFADIAEADDLPGFTAGLFERFSAFASQLKALNESRAGRRTRNRSVPRRNQIFRQKLAPVVKGMSEREALGATAVCKVLSSGFVWQILTEEWGLDGKEAGQAVAWAMRTLIQTLRQNPKTKLAPQSS